MYTRSVRVVQFMYRPLRGYSQTVPFLVVSVQSCRFDYHTSCSLGNVRHKFQSCTVDVQASIGF